MDHRLSQTIVTLYEEGRAAWPEVDVGADAFAAYVSARHPDGVRSGLSADLYLACACASGDPVALGVFDRRCLAELGPALAHAGDATLVAEATQELRAKLFAAGPDVRPRILDYAGTGNLHGWLKVAATRTAISLRRKERPSEALDDQLDLAAPGDDPELGYLRETYRAEFRAAFAEAVASLEPRDRNLLRYQTFEGLSVDEIGAIYNVHRATAARWVAKARESLVTRTRRALQRRLRVDQDELESVMRLIQSRLDLSLSHHFRTQR